VKSGDVDKTAPQSPCSHSNNNLYLIITGGGYGRQEEREAAQK